MGWNGSGQKGAAPVQPKVTAKKPSLIRGLVAGAVVVALAVVAYFAFFSGSEKPQAEKSDKGRGRIKEVKPAPAPASRVGEEPKKEHPPVDKRKLSKAWQQYYDGRDTNKWMVVYNPITKQEFISRIVVAGDNSRPPPLYKNHALNILDAIAFSPVVSIMANVQIDERFMQNLQDALINKVEISPEDSEEVQERKRGMVDLIADLKRRLKDGEDLQELVRESLKDRNRLATLRSEMEHEQSRMEDSGASQEEIEDFVELCNKKLKERGASPILSPRQLDQLVEDSILEKAEKEQQKGTLK